MQGVLDADFRHLVTSSAIEPSAMNESLNDPRAICWMPKRLIDSDINIPHRDMSF